MPISERELAERVLCTLIGEGISQIYDYYEIFEIYNTIHVGESLLEDLQKAGMSLNQLLKKFPKNFIYFGNGRWQGVFVGNSLGSTHSPPDSILLSFSEVRRALQKKPPMPTAEEVSKQWGFSSPGMILKKPKSMKNDRILFDELEKKDEMSQKVKKFLKHFESPKPPLHPPLSPRKVEQMFRSSAKTQNNDG